MKKSLLIVGQVLFCTLLTQGQEVIAPNGESYENSSGQIQFTIGETTIESHANGTNGITQGFHQTNLIISSTKNFTNDFEIAVFPNPVMNSLTIQMENNPNGMAFEMLDMNGKLVKTQILSGTENTLNVSQLAAGVYMLILKDENGELLKTYQIHKLN